jgi:hypothetical protein
MAAMRACCDMVSTLHPCLENKASFKASAVLASAHLPSAQSLGTSATETGRKHVTYGQSYHEHITYFQRSFNSSMKNENKKPTFHLNGCCL